MKTLIAITLFSFGCTAARPAVQYQGIPPGPRRVEDVALPDRPNPESLPEAQNYAIPLPQGTKAPKDGILLSPEKMERALELMLSYDELRTLYENDRIVWQNQRGTYEDTLVEANKEIVRLNPTWWDDHKLEIGLVGGAVIGIGLSLGVIYGVDQLSD